MPTVECCAPIDVDLVCAGLLIRTALGDRDALGDLFDLAAGSVFDLAAIAASDFVRRDEIVLEVFVKVWMLAPRFTESSSSGPAWILDIACSHLIEVEFAPAA